MGKRVRLEDIATRLKLTKVSVSKALRDHPDISTATRKLVKSTAEEMGYTPNLLARSLSSRRSNTLGVVVPKVAHTFFASVIDAIQDHVTEKGYGILLAVSEEDSALERQHIERLLAMRVDGLLVSVSQQRPDAEIYEKVRTMNVPLVFFDRMIDGLDFSSVTVNDRAGAFRAVDHMIRRGNRKIAHIAGSPDVKIGRERRAGYEAALEQHDIPVYDPWVIPGGFDEWHGYHAFKQIYESGVLPEVIFAVTFPASLGARAAMRQADPALLDRIQMLAFGEGGLNEFSTYPYVCVQQPSQEMGRRAAELLLREIEAGEHGESQHLVLETELVTSEHYERRLLKEMEGVRM